MDTSTSLLATIVVGFCLAFIFGIIANRLKTSPLVGYILAGILVGPYTGGFHANTVLIDQLAQIGIILFMFGVGLHFSFSDLLQAYKRAIPGALTQIVVSSVLGIGLGSLLGWPFATNLLFGLAISTASTVVMQRALQERHLIETDLGRLAIGWLIIEDFIMIAVLVVIPEVSSFLGGISPAHSNHVFFSIQLGLTGILLLTFAKVAFFIALMFIFGRRIIPWILQFTSQTASRELFSLSVLSIALGVASVAAELFHVSLSLGAFFAGMLMSESDLSHRAAEETLPLRDAFAVLFFVSVGMLFNPASVYHNFLPLIATLIIVMLISPAVCFFVMRAFKKSIKFSSTISASIAQIGEFAFILVSLGKNLKLLTTQACDVIVGAAILSILLNPVAFFVVNLLRKRFYNQKAKLNTIEDVNVAPIAEEEISLDHPHHEEEEQLELRQSELVNHVIIIGGGRIGGKIALALHKEHWPVLVIEESRRPLTLFSNEGIETLHGNGADSTILKAANITQAMQLIIAINNSFGARQICLLAQELNPHINLVIYTKDSGEADYLRDLGVNKVMVEDEEISKAILRFMIEEKELLKADSALPFP